MNCIIIDDEQTSRFILKKLISGTENLNLLREFSNAKDGLEYLIINEVDLIFLDLHMPQINGFGLLDLLPVHPRVVITTSDKEHIDTSFKYKCIIDYLQKPFNITRFLRAVDKANKPLLEEDDISIESFPENNDLLIKINRRHVCVKIDSISVIRTSGDKIEIFSNEMHYTVKYTLSQIIEKLPSNMLLKINEYYFVNPSKIKGIEDHKVLIGNHVIPISKANEEELSHRLNL